MATSVGSPLDPTPVDPTRTDLTTGDLTTDKPPRPRRWIPVSVRLLFLLAFLYGYVGFSLIAARGYKNAVTINEIEQLGGEVTTRPCAPKWLQRQDSRDWTTLLDEVVTIDPGYEQATDEWLAGLRGFTSLEALWLDGQPITDAGIEYLKGFKNLRRLRFDHAHVTDAGMVQLSELTDLESLSLRGTKVGDAGLVHLARLHNLEYVNLAFTQVSDAGLAHLKGLTNLKRLQLSMMSSESEYERGIADLKRALPGLQIEDGFYIRSSPYWFRQSHSPSFFASGALLMTGAVVVWSLGLIYLLPLVVAKLSGWFPRRRAGAAEAGQHSLAPEKLPIWLSRMVRFGRVTAALIVVTAGLLVALPIVRQQMAVHALERLGGSFEKRSRHEERGTHPAVGGLQQFHSLTSLQELWLGNSEIADSDLANLERLTSLQVLRLSGTPITDAALPHIQKLVELRELHLGKTHVTDAALPALKSLDRLSELDLGDTRITDLGASHLAEMGSLKNLRLENTGITDVGLLHLSRLTELTWLDLEGTGVSDAGLAHLAKLTRLQHLYLANMPQLTGKGIVHLHHLPNLESLSLDGRQFAEAGVESLRQLKLLNSLSLKDTQMSEAEVDEIKRALPGVFVHLEK